MPPEKKAAKKAAKKAVKKAPKKASHHEGHHHAKDLRRAFEHLGRVEIVRQALTTSMAPMVQSLTSLAEERLQAGQTKDAAELLRASEHLAFALLAGSKTGHGTLSAQLEKAVSEHYDELLERAEDHWSDNGESSTLAGVYHSALLGAAKALKAGSHHEALEYMRAAEAIAHVEPGGPAMLAAGRDRLALAR